MEPLKPLPFSPIHADADAYIDTLLQFVTQTDLFQTLCGGVHVLDFLTRDPDLYVQVLPSEWRKWLEDVPIMDFLDFLMRDDIDLLLDCAIRGERSEWRDRPPPPRSLLAYVQAIRQLSLDRSFVPSGDVIPGNLGRKLAAGMKQKKAHEVENFAAFVNDLIDGIKVSSGRDIDYIVDFGSGQNYLGRVLASPLYQRRVIAVESRHWNISSAMKLDINAKLREKIIVWRNRKVWRQTGVDNAEELRREKEKATGGETQDNPDTGEKKTLQPANIRYIEHQISNGDLSNVIEKADVRGEDGGQADESTDCGTSSDLDNLMVVSLHSCGNLLHHGLRSLTMNPSVKAVAMVGCCYNLVTERLGPPTKKLPSLRVFHKRLNETASACDPHGFPMSEKLASYVHSRGRGIRMNITARMMAVQAPQNWTEVDSEGFFTRHFFRALFQRIMFDKGFVEASPISVDMNSACSANDTTANGGTAPVTLGSLRKSCYSSFLSYFRGAQEKIMQDSEHASRFEECMGGLADDEILEYERRYKHKKHHLCIVWSLMAFSACVVEALMVTDRWLYLKEQPEVEKAWVQSCFDYQQSPRNLAVIGIKR